jgi:CheY-like chemotaxis protein
MEQPNRIPDATAGTVLVVEDDDALRESICALLRLEKIVVYAAADGLAALDFLARNRRPVLIILDLMLPKMNGWELRSRLNTDPSFSGIPILVISAYVARGIHAGPHGLTYSLAKPFKPEVLLAYVRRYVSWDGQSLRPKVERQACP